MLKTKLQEFLEASAQLIGVPNVHTGAEALIDHFTQSVSSEERRVPAALCPRSREEVVEIVRLANRYNVRLYPISRGKNWGLGSKLPVQDDCVILELSRMDRILEYDVEHGVLIVEPGVTQRQVYMYLKEHGGRHYLDVIGSAADASIVGNVLEGGVAYRGLRFEQATGFEIVTGAGEELKTGFGHLGPKIRATHCYKYGLGPSLDGLFHQSNFGIVVSMGIKVFTKPECQMAAIISIRDDADFPEFLRRLIAIKRFGITVTSIKIGDRERSRTTICPLLQSHLALLETDPARHSREFVEQFFDRNFGAWSALTGLIGTRSMVRAMRAEIRRIMKGCGRVRFVDQTLIRTAKWLCKTFSWIPAAREQLAILRSIEPLQGLMAGIPTNDTMPSLWWAIDAKVPGNCREPDPTEVGMIAYLPIIPANPGMMTLNVEVTRKIFEKHGFGPNMTMSIVDERFVWGVTDLGFNRRDPDAVQRAKLAIDELEDVMFSLGIVPQRLRIDAMKKFIRGDDPFWQVVHELKATFDPNNVIAPGRYNLI